MTLPINQIKLLAAERIFAVSNTPSFLLRKLRDDPAIRQLAEAHTPGSIIVRAKTGRE
jgi:hypothetical protein